MEILVKFFASAADAAGTREQRTELTDPADVTALMDALCSEHPKLERLRSVARVAVNLEYVSEEEVLRDGDEVAIIPPVSGGQ